MPQNPLFIKMNPDAPQTPMNPHTALRFLRPFAGILFPALWALLLVISFPATARAALPAEPDWKSRFDYWTSRHRARFREPRPNTAWAGTRSNGIALSGILTAVTDSGIALADGPVTSLVERTALSREDRTRLFREDYARASALETVLKEKQTYSRQTNPLLPAHLITQTRLLTAVQFEDYANRMAGFLLLQEGWVNDVRPNYFGAAEAVISLTPPAETNQSVICIFPLPMETAATVTKGSVLRFFGPIKSIRARDQNIRITLTEASLEQAPAPAVPQSAE